MKFCFGIESKQEQIEAFNNIPELVAVDVETVDLEGEAIGLAIAPSPNYSFFFTFDEPVWREILANRTCIFHNAKFDLVKLGMNLKFEDTYLIHKALGEEWVGLKALAWDKGLIEFPTAKELMRKHRAKNMLGVPIEEVAAMCCQHAQATYFLWEGTQIPQVYNSIDKPMVRVLMDMEERGVFIDLVELNRQLVEQQAILEERRQQFISAYGAINMNSPVQLKKLLGTESTDKHTLAKLGNYAAEVLTAYRKANKAINTYLLPFSKVNANERLHSSYDYTRTARLRSEKPDMQNITRGELRKIVAARPETVLIDADYEGLEFRAAAHISQDKVMLDAFAAKENFHAKTAIEVFGGDDPEKYMRGKTLNFAVFYGANDYKVAELVGCSLEEGKMLYEKMNKLYPGFAEFAAETKRFAKHNYYVETIFGRRRNIRELTSASFKERMKGLREAVNTVVQSPSADIVKLAMIDLADLPLTMQIHDELMFEVEKGEVEKTTKRVKEACETAYPLSCGLSVVIKTGRNYLECH